MPKDIFFPHEGNNFRPHLLRPKRAFLYSLFFIGVKIIVVAVVLGIPATVLTSPQTRIQMQRSIVTLTNEYRAQNDLPLLRHNRRLYESSYLKSRHMRAAGSFAHDDGTGFSVVELLGQVGYEYQTAGENLAVGAHGPDSMMQAWKQSPTHNANLLNPDFRETGVSVMATNEETTRYYVTHHFGTSNDEFIRTPSTTPFIEYNETKSKITWQSHGNQTNFLARAYIDGPISYAQVYIGGVAIPLAQDKKNPLLYEGSASSKQSAADFLSTAIEPTLLITSTDGTQQIGAISWDSVTSFELSPLQYYLRNKSALRHVFAPLFTVSNTIYLLFIGLFAFVLMIALTHEFSEKRYHSIGLSAFVILLLGTLMLI